MSESDRQAYQAFSEQLPNDLCQFYASCGFIEEAAVEGCAEDAASQIAPLGCDAAVAFYAERRADLDACLDGSQGSCTNDDLASFCPAFGETDVEHLCDVRPGDDGVPADTGPGDDPDTGPGDDLPAEGQLDCTALLECVVACDSDTCTDECSSRASEAAIGALNALADCMEGSGCAGSDHACWTSACAAQVNDCVGQAPSSCVANPSPCEVLRPCCSDSACVGTDTGAQCLESCTSSPQCASSCCASLEGGGGVCADASLCAGSCVSSGGDCSAADCCLDTTCVTLESGTLCLDNCATHSECASDCCVPLDTGGSVCAPSAYCGASCVAAGDECSPSGSPCCAGSVCVWIDYVGARCQTQSEECPSGCTNPYGSTCCRPPFCDGDCVGSPCCD